ncbi:MAG TPA: acetolactate synthase small subunit [Bacteroidales bacterium]|nr:acetolactate synthase small subunit [Bacteroidales bacterium]
MENKQYKVIELTVHNHSGVMSHITGLFSRRGYNLEGILCGRIGEGNQSRMYLLVEENEQFEQVVKQLTKLYDVLDMRILEGVDSGIFNKIEELITS